MASKQTAAAEGGWGVVTGGSGPLIGPSDSIVGTSWGDHWVPRPGATGVLPGIGSLP